MPRPQAHSSLQPRLAVNCDSGYDESDAHDLDRRGNLLGFPLAAVVRVSPATRQLQRIPELARETSEVVECHRITGEDCFFLKLHLRSIDDLEEILDRFTPYGRTTTSIIHSSPVPNRALPLSADEAPPTSTGM